MKRLLIFIILSFAPALHAQVNAASCNDHGGTNGNDVQFAINAATEGQTVNVPAGTCTWTTGVTISGKGIVLQGAGAGAVIALSVQNQNSAATVSLATGTQTFTGVSSSNAAGTIPTFTNGESLVISELGFLANIMTGTVTSWTPGTSTLVMNIATAAGTCGTTNSNMNSNCKRWLIRTPASTTIVNTSAATMIAVTEDTSFHTVVTGFHFGQGTGSAELMFITRNTGGVAILIHDNFFEVPGDEEAIDGNTSRGVIWSNSFVNSPFNQQVGIRTKDSTNSSMPTSWSTPSTFGMNDTAGAAFGGGAGQNNLYIETNYFDAASECTDLDDNSRTVFRYNFLNNAGCGTHGADTSFIGIRQLEWYNNVGRFDAATSSSDGSVPNLTWWLFIRGSTFQFHDNTLPAISSSYYGTKPSVEIEMETLQREDNYACWGSGFTTAGQFYYAIRQPAFGYVTGTGKVNWPAGGYNNASTTTDSSGYFGSVYVGDSEPIYLWNNTPSITPALSDYGIGGDATHCPASPAPDQTSSYIQSGRDYFVGTAKPGYTAYTYPHPLTITNNSAPPAPARAFFTGNVTASGSIRGSN